MNPAIGWRLAVHGGAGDISRDALTADQDAAYREGLLAALKVGSAILDSGGSALDAVEASVSQLENDPLFNAGYGAAFTAAGDHELDAAIMDGATLRAGAVAGLRRVMNPVRAARIVFERDDLVFVAGQGAEDLVAREGLPLVPSCAFSTERRWNSLEQTLKRRGQPIPDHLAEFGATFDPRLRLIHEEGKLGTVGAVALDRAGDVASATSTGGLNAKHPGRIGDTPIIGAGTYADNATCAVSATGTGEHFIRLCAARTIGLALKVSSAGLQDAVDRFIHDDLTAIGGIGGVIAISPDGSVASSFNTPGMYRGFAEEGASPSVKLYGIHEEPWP